jgi:hypothetical protein
MSEKSKSSGYLSTTLENPRILHQPKYSAERFGPAVSFLFPPEKEIKQ